MDLTTGSARLDCADTGPVAGLTPMAEFPPSAIDNEAVMFRQPR